MSSNVSVVNEVFHSEGENNEDTLGVSWNIAYGF